MERKTSQNNGRWFHYFVIYIDVFEIKQIPETFKTIYTFRQMSKCYNKLYSTCYNGYNIGTKGVYAPVLYQIHKQNVCRYGTDRNGLDLGVTCEYEIQ